MSARICRCDGSPGSSSDTRMRSLSGELYSSKRTQSLYFISSGRDESCSLYSWTASTMWSSLLNFRRVLAEGTKYLQHGMLLPLGCFLAIETRVIFLSFGKKGTKEKQRVYIILSSLTLLSVVLRCCDAPERFFVVFFCYVFLLCFFLLFFIPPIKKGVPSISREYSFN